VVKKRKKREKEENIKFKKFKNFKIKEKWTDGGGEVQRDKRKKKGIQRVSSCEKAPSSIFFKL